MVLLGELSSDGLKSSAVLVVLVTPRPPRRAGNSSMALSWFVKPSLPVRAGSRLSLMAFSNGWKSSPISGIELSLAPS